MARRRRTYEIINGREVEKRFDRVSADVAAMIKTVRETVFPTQGDLTLWTTIPQTSIGRWERPGRLPGLRTLLIVAQATGSRLTISMTPPGGTAVEVAYDPAALDERETAALNKRIADARRAHREELQRR